MSMLTGRERFHASGKPLGVDVASFWKWAYSDFGNVERGALAEYLVGVALGATDTPRIGWAPYDLLLPSGHKVEVKASGYVQRWPQRRLSTPRFDVAPTPGWNLETGEKDREPGYHADAYVFCLHAHRNRATIDPLDLDQWRFHVLPRAVVERGAVTYSLRRLAELGIEAVPYGDLKDMFVRVLLNR